MLFSLRSWLSDTSGDFIKQYKKQNIDEKSIFNNILQYIKKNVDYNSASLLLLGKHGKRYKTVAQHGDGCNLIKGMHFKMGSGLSAWLAQKRKVICLPNIHRGARHGHNPIRSFVAIPILYKDMVIGILNLAHITPNVYGPKEVKTLQNLTQSIASQIHDLTTKAVKGKIK